MEPIVAGLVPSRGSLLDERRRPDFRDVFGALARRSTHIRTAVTHVRLSTVDLTAQELANVVSVKVLLAEVSALQLDTEARCLLRQPRRAPNVRFLADLIQCGRLEVRSAPLAGWTPDFTVFRGQAGPHAVLTGFHAFERPYPHRGPALVGVHGEDAARLAESRHRELWTRAHDIGPVVWSLLARAEHQTARTDPRIG